MLGGLEELPAVEITRTGTTPVDHAGLPGGEVCVFNNDGKAYLSVTATTNDTVVDVFINEEVDEQNVVPHVIEVKKGESKLIGPFPTAIFNNADDQVEFELTVTEGVTVDALELSAITDNSKGEPRG